MVFCGRGLSIEGLLYIIDICMRTHFMCVLSYVHSVKERERINIGLNLKFDKRNKEVS